MTSICIIKNYKRCIHYFNSIPTHMYQCPILTPTYPILFIIIIIIIIIVVVFCVMLDKAVVNPALHFLFKEQTIYYTYYKSCKTKCIPQKCICHLCWLGKNKYLHYWCRYFFRPVPKQFSSLCTRLSSVTDCKHNMTACARRRLFMVHLRTLHSLPVSD